MNSIIEVSAPSPHSDRGVWRAALAVILAAALGIPWGTAHAAEWLEGRNYYKITAPRTPTVAPGKVEVTEVFSYACPACNLFVGTMHKLKQALPANAELDYLPAAFNSAEDWPMFQQAYFTAQVLGIADQSHDAMFDAVWKTHELAVIDPTTDRLVSHPPTIEDAARFYSKRSGVPVEKFVSTAKSFPVDVKIRSADAAIVQYGVDRTPTIVVNGKYRLNVQSAGGDDQVIELVKFLVAKETK
jgi:thiol:disulfide interchange protein DsbA